MDSASWQGYTRRLLTFLGGFALICTAPSMAEQGRNPALLQELSQEQSPSIQDTSHKLAIASLPLAEALIELGKQTRTSIIFATELTSGLTAPEITGQFTLEEALGLLLENTALQSEQVTPTVVAVRRRAEPESIETFIPNPLEELAVYGYRLTGSRLQRTDLEGASPVEILSAPAIQASGEQNVADLLRFLPSVSGNSLNTDVSDGGNGTASITLRGLPASNTLVLINGRRSAANGLDGNYTDLNTIPVSAIERIEIFKDGASAIYGSDAIAGVINIILRKEFDGFRIESYYGKASRGDLSTDSHSFVWGSSGERATFMLAGSYYQQGALYSRDRSLSANADGSEQGGVDLRSSATPNARFLDGSNAEASIVDGYTTEIAAIESGNIINPIDQQPQLISEIRAADEDDRFNHRDFTTSVVPSRQSNVYATASYQFNERMILHSEFSWSETFAKAEFAPTSLFTRFENLSDAEGKPIDLGLNQGSETYPLVPVSNNVLDLRRTFVELGPREQINESRLSRAALSLESQWRGWYWDVGVFHSRNRATEEKRNLIDGIRLAEAISTECINANIEGNPESCNYINLFAAAGDLDPAALDTIRVNPRFSGEFELSSLSANIFGSPLQLEAGDLQLAAGLEVRRESMRHGPSNSFVNSALIGGSSYSDASGARTIRDAYIEAAIPLSRHSTWAHSLDVELAARMSDYSDFGSDFNPKLGFKYRPAPELMLRGSFNQGFRVPSLSELYGSQRIESMFLDDPCAIESNIGLLPGCSRLSDTTIIEYDVITGGNPDLAPEESRAYSLGVIWDPTLLPDLHLAIDLYDIDQKNVVDASAQFLLDQVASGNTLFADRVSRDFPRQNLEFVDATNINIGSRKVRGLDIEASYHFPLSDFGETIVKLNATHLISFKNQLDPSAPQQELAGTFSDAASEGLGTLPEWKALLTFQWQRQDWAAHYNFRYISSVEEDIPKSKNKRDVAAWYTHNIQLNYRLPWSGISNFSLGVENLFDRDPPYSASAFNDNYDPRSYDIEGRFLYAKISHQF